MARRTFFTCIGLLTLALHACSPPDMPARGGRGELALIVDETKVAPAYHSPTDRWRIYHPRTIAAGIVTVQECRQCHTPRNYCNRCHAYVGARLIAGSE